MLTLAILIAAGGGNADSTASETTDSGGHSESDASDPCTLVDEAILASYFGEPAVAKETGVGD